MSIIKVIDKLPRLSQIVAELRRRKENAILKYYPETGDLRRELYNKFMEYFKAGASHNERCLMAANRVGKTEGVGAYEVTCHLTGNYPDWWEGRRFDKPVKVWAAGDTGKTTRDIIQRKLLGDWGDFGTGMIPADKIIDTKSKAGIQEAIEIIRVRHKSGGKSIIVLKSYDQRREAFQGTEQDVIWLDEEPPMDVYQECYIRLMTTNGLLMLTFTPLMGITEVVKSYIQRGESSKKFFIQAEWSDVPHISPEQREAYLEEMPEFQRDARSKGIPTLGAGVIYPVVESSMLVDDFPIPEHWPRWYGMDVGWNWTAALWFALDRETDTTYIWSTYKAGQAEPVIHAEAIKSRGDWIRGVCDYAGTNQSDGTRIIDMYINQGLKIDKANKAVEAGIYKVWQAKSLGKLKIFRSCSAPYIDEQRLYRRDENGKIVKDNDHLMDSERYGIMAPVTIYVTKAKENNINLQYGMPKTMGTGSWMG